MKTMAKTLFASALILATSTAFGSAKLEMITNYKTITYGDDYLKDDSSKHNYSTTQVDRLRLGVSGKATDKMSVSARFNFRDVVNATNSNYLGVGSESGGIIDYAFVDYTVAPGLVFTLGKLATQSGGQELKYSSGDVYFYSKLIKYTFLDYAGGFGVAYTAGDHAFTFQSLNDPNSPSQTGSLTEPGATRSYVVLDYFGKFMDNKLSLNAWTSSVKLGVLNKGASVLGVKYDFGVVVLDFDFVTASEELTTTSKSEAAGQVVNVAIPSGDLKYIVKLESSDEKVSGTKTMGYSNFGVAAQWNLVSDGTSHLHAAYNVLSSKAETAGAKAHVENQLFVGTKIFVDILK